jgi:hypothetical protein
LRLHWNTDYPLYALNALGLFLLYCAIFLYEDVEGRIENRAAEWWVRVDDARIATHSWAAAFLQVVARLTLSGYNRVLGERLLSLRFAGVSVCLSIFSILLFIAYGALHTHLVPALGPLFFAALFLFSAFVPAFFSNRWVLRLWGICLFVTIVSPLSHLLYVLCFIKGLAFALRTLGCVILSFIVSLLSDISYVALTRWMLRRISAGKRVYEIGLLALLNLASLYVVFLGPIQLGVKVFQYSQGAGMAIMFSFAFNAVDFFAGLAALVLAVLLLLHRLLWALIEKPLYVFQRYKIVRNKKLLWSVGLVLVFLPTHMSVDFVQRLIEKLGAVVGA